MAAELMVKNLRSRIYRLRSAVSLLIEVVERMSTLAENQKADIDNFFNGISMSPDNKGAMDILYRSVLDFAQDAIDKVETRKRPGLRNQVRQVIWHLHALRMYMTTIGCPAEDCLKVEESQRVIDHLVSNYEQCQFDLETALGGELGAVFPEAIQLLNQAKEFLDTFAVNNSSLGLARAEELSALIGKFIISQPERTITT